MLSKGVDCFGPFDFALHDTHAFLDDRVLHLLLRLAHSGLVGMAWSAPPCKEFSCLKLRQPGPKALRTPEYMDGVPGLSPEEQAKVDASAAIHSRSREVLRGVVSATGQAGMEQPPSAMSWLQPDNVAMLREWSAHCSYVAACTHGLDIYKSWAMCATFESIAQLASTCQHPPGSHRCIAGAKVGNKYLSELTAEYPESLAHSMADIFAPFVTSQGRQNASVADFANLLPETYVPQRLTLCDGAGMNSNADRAFAKPSKLKALADKWWAAIQQTGAPQSILEHLQEARPEHPFSATLQRTVATIAAETLLPSCNLEQALHIPEGQPYRLRLLQALASHCNDPDSSLIAMLEDGVPAGIFSDVPTSHQWQQRQDTLSDTSQDDIQLQQCTGNWTRAERDPVMLRSLVTKEIQAGHVASFSGDRTAAAKHWPQGIAIGKLNIVLAEGRDPRLVLDSTVCNANTLCRIPEHVALPSAHEVMKSFQHSDAYGNWIALALDFKAAHKTIKVRPQEQGTLLFELDGALHHYTVCHFGAKFSAYWWSRLGALLTRTAHELLAEAPHRMWLYVDDLLTLLQKQQCTRPVCILLAFLTCINAPISWKKAQLGAEVVWCGWNFSFAFETLHLPPAKLAKLRNQLQTLCKSRKVQRKLLEATLGLLMWAASTCPHLRPYMAPLYRDLRSAAGTLKLIHPRLWQTFLNALDSSARVAMQPPGLWLPFKAQVIRAGSQEITCKADLPRVVSAQKGMWVRIADPQRAELHLRPESRDALQWLLTCFAHDRRRTLRQKPLLHCFAAADARADGDLIGIGGWIVTANRCAWFAEHWQASEIRAVWPQLSEAPQRYIACFETLAQLALAMTAQRSLGAQQWTFSLPAASENTAAEAQTEKLWSTAEPLGSFLKLTAAWAARHHVELLVTHLAGERNAWADELSRGKLHRFQHRTADRISIGLHQFLDASGCVTLHPPSAAWAEPLSAAQLPSRKEF